MGVMDRVRQRQTVLREQAAVESQTDSPSSLVLAEPPHIKRVKAVLKVLQDFISKNDEVGNYRKLAFILTAMAEELTEELSELDEIKTRIFMFQMGAVISWIGHGDNEQLPDAVKEFAEMVTGGDNATSNG